MARCWRGPTLTANHMPPYWCERLPQVGCAFHGSQKSKKNIAVFPLISRITEQEMLGEPTNLVG
jgi:hypothetical protein